MNPSPPPVVNNSFKKALYARQAQIGLWLALADSYSAEIVGGSGFEWLLIDNEHAPNDLRSVLRQLQAVASAAEGVPGEQASHPVVRLPVADDTLIKQYLDIGAQTLLLPMIDTPEQAVRAVRASRYPPEGVRGMGSGISRSSRWQRFPHYLDEANEQICVLVQAESLDSICNLDAIAGTDGVDGVFIGPADLSASMGLRGQQGHPEVRAIIDDAISRILAAGKAPGILCTDAELARHYLEQGAVFVAVGVDTSILSAGATSLRRRFD